MGSLLKVIIALYPVCKKLGTPDLCAGYIYREALIQKLALVIDR